mgnify:CR=1 FL=1
MKKILFLLILLFIPISVHGEELISNAKSGILIEANSGKILFEKEKDMEVSVASMTKMVAQIIILEEIEKGNIHWDDVIIVSKNASDMGGSQIYLEQGEKITIEDLMKGISVASGNDATVAMAELISGTEEKFVKRMNDVVKRLNLSHTHFMNSTGLDEDNHYSSAYDMAMIARELVMKHSEILRFSSIYEDYLREDSDRKFWLVNTNKLIGQYEGTDGLKTGHTDNSGYCLAATVKRNNYRLIGIVLGEDNSKVRNQETMKLLDYGFSNTKYKVLKKKGTIIKDIVIPNSKEKKLKIGLKEDLGVVEEIGDNNTYQYDIEIYDYQIPLNIGDKIGIIRVKKDKNVIIENDLVSMNEITPMSYFELLIENGKNLLLGQL